MKDYLLVILSVILLAFGFILQKVYQRLTADTTEGGIDFSIISAVFSIILLILTSGFSISFTRFSAINAMIKSACCLAYTVIGFKIMKEGSVALYMLFLMSGGMLVPSVWGWIFLDEEPKLLHILGLAVILVSIILNNLGKEKLKAKVLLMCCAVFVLNGFVSVFSKLHQVNTVYEMVPTLDYAMLSTVASLIMSLILKAVLSLKNAHKDKTKFKFSWLPIIIVASYSILGTVSSILQLEGAKNLPASMLYPMITGGSVALTGVFALIFFKEKLSARGWVSVTLCCIGTCFFI